MMMTTKPNLLRRSFRENGAALLEFALVAMVFFMLLIGIMEFGRWLFTWNAAVEATRWGARLAVVCNRDEPNIKNKMRLLMPQLQDANITITYYDPPGVPSATCGTANCKTVKVGITGVTLTLVIPIVNFSVPVPPFSTSLVRESMDSAADVCN